MTLILLAMSTWLACAQRAAAPPPTSAGAATADARAGSEQLPPAALLSPSPGPVAPPEEQAAPADGALADGAFAEDAGDGPVDQALAALDLELQPLRQQTSTLDGSDPDQVAPLLAAMVAVDQRLRNALDETPDEGWGLDERLHWVDRVEDRVRDSDRTHTQVVKALIDQHGWFDIGRFGRIADQDGWILVQHATHDPDFQARVLALLQDRVDAGQSDPSRYAYLYDRLQALAGQPQRYGTQGRCTGPGTWEALPLEDADMVDRWRAEVDLGTLEAYQAQVGELCR